MQTERKQLLCLNQFQDCNKVLEALINHGICDKVYPNIPNRDVDLVMCHLSSMAQRLLVRIENLELQVFSG